VIRTIVINLDRSSERLSRIASHLDKLGIEWERFSAVDGKATIGDDEYDFDGWREKHPNYSPPVRTTNEAIKGWLGCLRSHRGVAEMVASSWTGPVMVLEDDARLKRGWEESLENMREAVKPELSLLGNVYIPSSRNRWVRAEHPRLCHAYVIEESQTAADLAECWMDESVECDEVWWKVTKRGRTYALTPSVAIQQYGVSEITDRKSGKILMSFGGE
jgi:hypothetical protein